MQIISKKVLQQWYEAEYAMPRIRSIYGKPAKAMKLFFKLLDKRNPKQILEIGCGDGRNLIELAKMGHMVTGIDLVGENTVQKRAKKNRLKIKFIRADITTIDFERNKYDIIISSEVFHLLKRSDVQRAISKMKKATKKGGFVYISILSNLKRKFLKTKKLFKYSSQAYYTSAEAIKILTKRFSSWSIIKRGKFHENQSWPIKKGNYPIPDYQWSGDYIYIIAQKK